MIFVYIFLVIYVIFVISYILSGIFYKYIESITSCKIHSRVVIMIFGIIIVPLFENTIKDTLQYNKTKRELVTITNNLPKYDPYGELYGKKKAELLILNRTVKIIFLKYKSKNFVVRFIFNKFTEN